MTKMYLFDFANYNYLFLEKLIMVLFCGMKIVGVIMATDGYER